MPTSPKICESACEAHLEFKAVPKAQLQSPPAAPSSQPAVDGKATPSASRLAEFRKQIPKMLLDFEPQPLRVRETNPLLKEESAAVLLAVSPDLLKKWRQRDWGPNYIQYGKDGPVRYEFEALMDFRERHRVEVRSKK